ncbi:MAG: periplasmic heavy metal sensor [Gammaproteobacteria bacterium]|nr:periplasmic heavy metal sensor [Gammaproteobacteria bacterium]
MKRIATVLSLSVLIVGVAVAATPGGGPGGGQAPQQMGQAYPGPDMKALAKELGLSEDQTARLKTIMEQHRAEMQAMHQSMRQTGMQRGQEFMQQRRAQRDKHREQLLTVLNHEQLYKFEKFMEQNRPRGGMGMGNGMMGGMGGPGTQGPSSQP